MNPSAGGRAGTALVFDFGMKHIGVAIAAALLAWEHFDPFVGFVEIEAEPKPLLVCVS